MTRDRLVAALRPIALDELSGEDLTRKIAAITETPRRGAGRTRRAPRRRLVLTAAVAGLGAAAVATAIVATPGGGDGHKTGVVPLGPAKAQPAALTFTKKSGYLTVIVQDPTADPARYRKEFAAHGLNVDLRLTPSARREAGEVLFVEDDGGKVKTVTSRGHCGADVCHVGIKIPLTYKAFVRVSFGRVARPGEHYQTGPGDTPGEGVGLSDVRGRTVADVLAEAKRRHIGDIEYRYRPTSRSEQGSKQPYQDGVPAGDVKGGWRVYDAVAGTGGRVILFVHP
jgi:hypothetical protein